MKPAALEGSAGHRSLVLLQDRPAKEIRFVPKVSACQQQRKIDRGGLLTEHCHLAAVFHNLVVLAHTDRVGTRYTESVTDMLGAQQPFSTIGIRSSELQHVLVDGGHAEVRGSLVDRAGCRSQATQPLRGCRRNFFH